MKTTTKIVAAAATILSLAVASAVFAHPGFGMGPGMGWGPGAASGFMGGMGPGMGSYGMSPGGGGFGPGMRGMHPGNGPGTGSWGPGQDMSAVAASHVAQLKSELKITPAQESAWKAYEAVVTQQASAMQAMRNQFVAQAQNAQPGAAPADFAAQREAMFKLHETNFKAHDAALKDLYAVLTPEQRAIADRGLGHMGAHRGPGWAPGR